LKFEVYTLTTILTCNRNWTAYSHHLQEDRIARQYAETKTGMYDRCLRRKIEQRD